MPAPMGEVCAGCSFFSFGVAPLPRQIRRPYRKLGSRSRMSNTLFTSESVFPGHPDKVADQISDAVLDAMLAQDPLSRVACETMVTTGVAIIAGEVTTKTYVHIPDVVRSVVRDIGYVDPRMGFDADSCAVMVSLDKQSPDI